MSGELAFKVDDCCCKAQIHCKQQPKRICGKNNARSKVCFIIAIGYNNGGDKYKCKPNCCKNHHVKSEKEHAPKQVEE